MTVPARRRAPIVRVLLAATGAAALLAGCASDGGAEGPTIDEIQEPQHYFEGEYLGQTVTVSAEVAAVLGPSTFELAGDVYGDDSILVLTPAQTVVEVGRQVRVTGTVGQFHRVSEWDYPPGQNDLYDEYETEAYLYDATVQSLAD